MQKKEILQRYYNPYWILINVLKVQSILNTVFFIFIFMSIPFCSKLDRLLTGIDAGVSCVVVLVGSIAWVRVAK